MNFIKKSVTIIVVVITSGILINAVSNESLNRNKLESKRASFPTNLDFAGEKVPMTIADVHERLDKELLINEYMHGSTNLIIRRANRAFPIIEPILKKNGVPDDFKYLAVIESALVNAVSPAGARGIWQFMPATAKENGMEVTETVDERYHLEKSTEAACKYLIDAKQKLGSWTLAAASYNGGIAGITRQIEYQKVTDYYDLLLTEETSRYVFRILALKEIMLHPEQYGFNVKNEDLYNNIPTRQVKVDSSITNLADFALKQGINYKILKLHNPWLRDRKLENKSRKVYIIEIPTSGY